MKNISLDCVTYRVRIKFPSLQRSFEIVEGPNSGTAITSRAIRDIIGTGYSYTMQVEPDPAFPDDYDNFYNAISAPVESHRIEFPYGQETIVFDAYVQSGSDNLGPNIGGVRRWNGLSVTFKPMEPQRINQ